MARMARAVAPGFPHHITQRGNRRQQTFFSDQDYQSYLALMAEWCVKLFASKPSVTLSKFINILKLDDPVFRA
jgi:REP element-mobilizing transposase RayT